MPKYYCDYCDTYLTHDSPSVRKTHNGGRKHLENVVNFYQQLQDQEIQRKVDSTIQSFTSGFRNAMGGMPPMMPVMGNPFMQPNFYHPGMSFPPIPIPSPGTFPPGPVPPGFNESLPLPPGPPVPPLAGPPNHFPPTGHPGQLMGPSHPNFQQQRISQFS